MAMAIHALNCNATVSIMTGMIGGLLYAYSGQTLSATANGWKVLWPRPAFRSWIQPYLLHLHAWATWGADTVGQACLGTGQEEEAAPLLWDELEEAGWGVYRPRPHNRRRKCYPGPMATGPHSRGEPRTTSPTGPDPGAHGEGIGMLPVATKQKHKRARVRNMCLDCTPKWWLMMSCGCACLGG